MKIKNYLEKNNFPNPIILKTFKPGKYSKIIIFKSKNKKYVLKKALHYNQENIDETFKRECRSLKKIRDTLKEEFIVPEIVFVSKKRRIHVTRFLEGKSLKELILKKKLPEKLFYQLGQKLNFFHSKMPSPGRENNIQKTSYKDFVTWNIFLNGQCEFFFLDAPQGLEKRPIYEDLAFFIISLYIIFIKKNPLKLLLKRKQLKKYQKYFLKGYQEDSHIQINQKTLNHYIAQRLLLSISLQKERKGFKNKFLYRIMKPFYLATAKKLL